MATETTNPQRGSESGGTASNALNDAARLFQDSWKEVDFFEEDDSTKPGPDVEDEDETVSEADAVDSELEEATDELLPDDDTDEEAADQPATTKVRLRPDDEVELPDGTTVKYSELVSNASKGVDYTRKTQELAAERSTVKEVTGRYQQLSKQLNDQLEWANTLIAQVMPQPPDLSLMHQDIYAYTEAKAVYEQAMAYVQRLQSTRQQTLQQQQKLKQDRNQLEQHLFREKLPHLRDEKKLRQFTQRFAEAMPHYGFTPEEVADWSDHRVYLMIDDALYGRAVRAGKANAKQEVEKVKKKALPPVAKPGTRNTKPASAEMRRRQRATDELKKTGDVRAGAASILHLID